MDYDAPNGWDMGAHVNHMGFTNTIAGTGLYHIWLHEFGHGIGFPDYYDWSTWAPGVAAAQVRDERRRRHHGHRLGQVDVQTHLERASAHEPLAVSRTGTGRRPESRRNCGRIATGWRPTGLRRSSGR